MHARVNEWIPINFQIDSLALSSNVVISGLVHADDAAISSYTLANDSFAADTAITEQHWELCRMRDCPLPDPLSLIGVIH